jgi:preprotein translocase subunit SecA
MLVGSDADVIAELRSILDDGDAEFMKMVDAKQGSLGDAVFAGMIRQLFLRTIDTFWVEHLEAMDYLRSSVNLRAYGQRDPLVEYKKEGLFLWKGMQQSVNTAIIEALPHLGSSESATPSSAPLSMSAVEAAAREILGDDSAPKEGSAKHGRNDKVVMIKGGEEKEVKWKKVADYERDGWKIRP